MKTRYLRLVALVIFGLAIAMGFSLALLFGVPGQQPEEPTAATAASVASLHSLTGAAPAAPVVIDTPVPTPVATPGPPCGPLPTWVASSPRDPARYAVQGAIATDGNPRFTPVPYFYVVGGLNAS